jgi:hypothetical protein
MGHKGPVSKGLGASGLQGPEPTINQSIHQSINKFGRRAVVVMVQFLFL